MSLRPNELYGQPWQKRDLVIALAAYFQNRDKPAHISAPWILSVAEILGRTPASVLMRMGNFASLDPATPERGGLARGGPLCYQIFRDWHHKPAELNAMAEFLIDEELAKTENSFDLFNPERIRLPRAFGKYELLDSLGSGGFGAVYSCIMSDGTEPKAIKVIKIDAVDDREILHRFYREIQTLKSMAHPHVIRIYEDNLQSEVEFPAFVMDLATCNLTDYVKRVTKGQRNQEERPRIGADEAVRIMVSMLSAIEALHQHRPVIIHRDLNPNNILLLPDNRWVLADFGLAKFLYSAPLTTAFATGTTKAGVGTAYYAAPEQYRDFAGCQPYTDIYALGMLIWELFSTHWPEPDRADTGLPKELQAVFLKAAHRQPAQRYASVGEMRRAFVEAIQVNWPWAIRADSDMS
jgi:serine/threonine protein kinase